MTKTAVSIFVLLLSFCVVQLSSSTPYITNSYEDALIAKLIGFRLPTNTAPRLYTLSIEPHMEDEDFSFDGTSSVLFEVLSPTSIIVIHAADSLDIDKSYTKLKYGYQTIVKPVSQKWNSKLELFSIQFRNSLKVGNYTLEMRWRGRPVYDERTGAYDGFYREQDERKYDDDMYLAVTQFQPMAARTAFPCWDEPALKAEFNIAIRHHPNYTALSNMPAIEDTQIEDEKVWTLFERTPPMPTSQVAFAVVPYGGYSSEGRNVTIWIPEERLPMSTVTFEMTRVLPAVMHNYTDIPYELPKINLIVMPKYWSKMTESWGLIAYPPPILFDPNLSGAESLHLIMLVTATEVAHQWFGNLVTPAWWDDVWLSDSISHFLSYKLLNDILEKWNGKEILAVTMTNEAGFAVDQRHPGGTHPIKLPVEKKEDIGNKLSGVTHGKGALVIRMLENILTEKTFRLGIQKYLKKHKFGSVTSDDLWASLQEAHNEKRPSSYLNIKELMDPWIEQKNYPLVNVTRDPRTGLVTIVQSDAVDDESGNLWKIPINYATKSQPSFESTLPTHWLRRSNDSLVLYRIEEYDWVIVNIQQTGFYRVNYDWENWKRLTAYLNSEDFYHIHVINRAQILYDLIYFAETDDRYHEVLFDALTYLHREDNYLPWTSVIREIKRWNDALMNTSSYDTFKRFMLYLMNSIVNRIGFDDNTNDDYLTRLGRAELIPWACTFGHHQCEAAASVKLMESFVGEIKKTSDPNSKAWIYCTALRYGDRRTWDMVMDTHSANPREIRAYKYLGCTNNQFLITRYLNLAMAENATLLTNDIFDAFQSLIARPGGHFDFALNLWMTHNDRIMEYFETRQDESSAYEIPTLFAATVKTVNQFETFTSFLRRQEEDGKMESASINELTAVARNSMYLGENLSAMFNSIIHKKPSIVNIIHNMHISRFDY